VYRIALPGFGRHFHRPQTSQPNELRVWPTAEQITGLREPAGWKKCIGGRVPGLRDLKTTMYLLTWTEKDAKIDASLGGRVTAEEMAVLLEELQDVIDSIPDHPFSLCLDYSKAKQFDDATASILEDLLEFCHGAGVERIVSIVRDEDDLLRHVNARLQRVMEGREQYVVEPEELGLEADAIGSVDRRAA
jgi:anti-anti-sigma regulatory factor